MRSAPCSMRCAPHHQLQSISFLALIVLVLVVGILLFGIGSSILRRLDREPPAPAWPKLLDESLEGTDAELRRDMAERLALLHSDWSRGVLETALSEERDPAVLAVIKTALS